MVSDFLTLEWGRLKDDDDEARLFFKAGKIEMDISLLKKCLSFVLIINFFSFGIILWELLVRTNPFEEYNEKFRFQTQLEEAILNGLR